MRGRPSKLDKTVREDRAHEADMDSVGDLARRCRGSGRAGISVMSVEHRVDRTVVRPGQLAKMTHSGARPSPALQAAIDRARERKRQTRGFHS